MKPEPCRMLVEQLHSWLHRKTISSSIRRIATLPIALATDIGLSRDENQDRVAVMKYRSLNRSHDTVVIALADGMGGMVGGANAASLTISSFFSSMIENAHVDLSERLVDAVQSATNAVYKHYQGEGGATLSAVVIEDGDSITGVNVGDSRIYDIFNGSINQISEDDTVAALAQKYNEKKLELDGRFNHELVQFIGLDGVLEPHFYMIQPEKFKTVILTSDGAHTIGNDNIIRLMTHSNNIGVFVKRTIDLANWFGGGDNSSIAAIDLSYFNKGNTGSQNGVINIWDPYGELQVVNVFSDDSQDVPLTESNMPEVLKGGSEEACEKPKDLIGDICESSEPKELSEQLDMEKGTHLTKNNSDVMEGKKGARFKGKRQATTPAVKDNKKNKVQLDISFLDKNDGKSK
ncbi:TPA: serine/threonine-protein phosphatase [Serratia marcescens]|uniref:PP2C family protein-serine/threonine phosphatase n=2 Tax=Serratia marcescens TaxID=615 RepID=UPI0018D7C3C7|nr:protein phosphatase 2C domain-containing protein [Serratia marcescens]MBH2690113.1 serine/threonine-protein phosphatase [Serratia marcescens]MBH2737806.1 serine/threonine-protein phosphatase [Serratia marcescens]MBH2829547.1 serine/threonine-protein phosphatase [Serratia marcescens]MBH3223448.1 serine/threonine-protein phosphatase [Serratia marcescens]QVV71875.1 serine/threonine-protein phosphatase [Serratia marcescens]